MLTQWQRIEGNEGYALDGQMLSVFLVLFGMDAMSKAGTEQTGAPMMPYQIPEANPSSILEGLFKRSQRPQLTESTYDCYAESYPHSSSSGRFSSGA